MVAPLQCIYSREFYIYDLSFATLLIFCSDLFASSFLPLRQAVVDLSTVTDRWDRSDVLWPTLHALKLLGISIGSQLATPPRHDDLDLVHGSLLALGPGCGARSWPRQ